MSYATLLVNLEPGRPNSDLLRVAADLIVAGAYGHSRVREWVLGGVTDDLLLSGKRCTLVSH